MNLFKIFLIIYCNIICSSHCLSLNNIQQQQQLQKSDRTEGEEKLVIEKLVNIIRNQQDRSHYPDDNQPTEQDSSEQYGDFYENALNQPAVDENLPLPLYPDSEAISAAVVKSQEKTLDTTPIQDTGQQYIKVDAKASIPVKFQRNDPETQYKYDLKEDEKSSSSSEERDSIEKISQSERDSIQRKKLYSYLTQNPSFIPYGHAQSAYIPNKHSYFSDRQTTNILAITYGSICGILVITIFSALLFYRKLKKKVKDAEDVDYPAYGVTGPSKEIMVATSDRHLAHSAQMYHYQHQKQQIKAMENVQTKTDERRGSDSASDEDDFTVYECPGLAATGEMEVQNPMFQGEVMENSADDKQKPIVSAEDDNVVKNGKESKTDKKESPTESTKKPQEYKKDDEKKGQDKDEDQKNKETTKM